MKRTILPLLFVLILAACGSSTNEVGTASDDVPDNGLTEGSLPLVDDIVESEEPLPVPGQESTPIAVDDEFIITNSVMIDPQTTTPSELALNPDNDSELWIRFVGADPNCTAASASVITETPDAVQVELLVGLTEDALARSCMAGEFNLRVDIALNESATGKDLQAVESGPADANLVTPDLSTDDFIGLTEDEAAALADENTIPWRTVAVDGEFFAVTQDFSPERLNFEIESGVITNVSLG